MTNTLIDATPHTIIQRVYDWYCDPQHNFSYYEGASYYRDPRGNRCAVGVLIDDSEYLPAMDGCMENHDFEVCCPEDPWTPSDFASYYHLSDTVRQMLWSLQILHDKYAKTHIDLADVRDEFLDAIENVGTQYGVTVSKV